MQHKTRGIPVGVPLLFFQQMGFKNMVQEWGLILAIAWAGVFGYSGLHNDTKKPEVETIIIHNNEITKKDVGIIN